MSAAVFADTFYFLALLNTDEGSHSRAVAASTRTGQSFVTTEWVLLELADALSRPNDRSKFITVWDAVRSEANFHIIPASSGHLAQGVALYRARMDKEWSLTDCPSFVAMKEQGLSEALTGDRHFEQAGFKALLVGA